MSTLDKYAQYFTHTSSSVASGSFVDDQVRLPIVRVPRAQRVTILEIVRICIHFASVADISAAVESYFSFAIDTNDPGAGSTSITTNTSRTSVIWAKTIFLSTKTTGYASFESIDCDTTDGDGHGILVATDFIYLTHLTKTVGTQQFVWKVWYKFTPVDIYDYIGIVQSQS